MIIGSRLLSYKELPVIQFNFLQLQAVSMASREAKNSLAWDTS